LDSAGGDNTAFVDDVQLSQASATGLTDGGFESAAVGGGTFQYAPSGTAWSYDSSAGVSGNGSGFTSGNPGAPEGSQVAFLQGDGSFSQSVAGLAAGSYQLTFAAAQRGNFAQSGEDFEVLVDGQVVGTFAPSGTSYGGYATSVFAVGAGTHTVTFVGVDTAGGDNTAFVDNVVIFASS
jgi:hypothetical protein